MIKISPSMLSSDFSNLDYEAKKLKEAGADMLHMDVMDGHFVDNITMGPVVISSLRQRTNLLLDVHLMITDPFKYVNDFIDAGSDIITIHYESESDIRKTLETIKKRGKIAGLSIKPKTPANVILNFLDIVDMVLIMTVEPGFGGQHFIKEMLPKIEEVKKLIGNIGREIDIQVDGGIDSYNVKEVINSGANIIVSGSYIFKCNNYKKQIDLLKGI